MTDYYRLIGREVVRYANIDAYVEAMRNGTYQREPHVGDTTIKGVRISTVFLSMDYAYGAGPPMVFETMVFGGQLDQEQVRYSTYDEAEAGHAAMVERVKDAEMSELERKVREVRDADRQ